MNWLSAGFHGAYIWNYNRRQGAQRRRVNPLLSDAHRAVLHRYAHAPEPEWSPLRLELNIFVAIQISHTKVAQVRSRCPVEALPAADDLMLAALRR